MAETPIGHLKFIKYMYVLYRDNMSNPFFMLSTCIELINIKYTLLA